MYIQQARLRTNSSWEHASAMISTAAAAAVCTEAAAAAAAAAVALTGGKRYPNF